MNAPTLWGDFGPLARYSDPVTSREAAERVKPAGKALVAAIRQVVSESAYGPLTAFDIAERVEAAHRRRWDEGTIRTAVSRAGLRAADTLGRSPRGSRCIRYSL